ncbi:ATP-dependent zinc protease (plasmid) [Acaryochloris sp. 'Moss Beach']|uniref:ATP-dependent zinc protease family protein n=1 Tax=Acaryochloris TaxID=155977 RepID=UPI001BB0552D|nr:MULTISPECIES: ATP-dependent zinc protease [Acaryochloris]QUY40326.1 ATP-dependent zinc protease [Acaryochloris marina S15]UJB72257.1 ATP-dependent zinc protease [Acaryochloris sp. 'Moss Beach']
MTASSSQVILPIIGWREWVSFPELEIPQVKAKIDTGARSSALHAFDIERFQDNGKSMLRFKTHPIQKDKTTIVTAIAELLEVKQVRDSGGHTEMRPVILTEIALSNYSWKIEVTLTDRSSMGFRMLLGRQAVRQRFVIDVGQSYIHNSDPQN